MPVHPLAPGETHTALNALVARHPELVGVGEGGLRSGVVHRLDTGTSGVLVFALRRRRVARGARGLHARSASRSATWRVCTARSRGSARWSLLLENRGNRVRVVGSGGRLAVSSIRALETGAETSLVEVEMRTGVRHQIRATLAELGHPIVGDALYGSTAPLGRHWLHCASIAWDAFAAESEPPSELRPQTEDANRDTAEAPRATALPPRAPE